MSSGYREDIVMAIHQHQVRDDLREAPSERKICAQATEESQGWW